MEKLNISQAGLKKVIVGMSSLLKFFFQIYFTVLLTMFVHHQDFDKYASTSVATSQAIFFSVITIFTLLDLLVWVIVKINTVGEADINSPAQFKPEKDPA